MADHVLEVQQREITGKKVSQLRAQGLVPVTVYGPQTKAINLQIPYRSLELMLMKAGGTHLIDLSVNGSTYTVLAREVQRDVLKRTLMHVDFFAVDLKAKVTTQVPVHLIGESPAVQAKLGVLISGLNSLSLEALPMDLIDHVDIDLSGLKQVGDGITVGDLKLGGTVEVLNDPEEMIVRVIQTSAAQSEEDELADAAVSPEVEVIAKGKGDEDEDEG